MHYLQSCEGDDFWCCPTKLQEQVEYLEAHPECGLVHSNAHIVNATTQKIIRKSHQEDAVIQDDEDQARDPLLKWRVTTCTAVVRMSVYMSLKAQYPHIYYRKRRLGDLQLWAGLMATSKAHYSPNVYAAYQFSPESTSRSRNPAKMLLFNCEVVDVYMEVNEVFNDDNPDLREDIVNRYAAQLTYLAYKANNRNLLLKAIAVRNQDRAKRSAADRVLAYGAVHNIPMSVVTFVLRCISLYCNPLRTIQRSLERIGSNL